MRKAPQCICNGARRALHRVFVSSAALGPPMMGGRGSGMEQPQPRYFTRPSRPPPSRPVGGGGLGGGGLGGGGLGGGGLGGGGLAGGGLAGGNRGGGFRRPPPRRNPIDEDDVRGFDRRYTTREDIEKMGRDRPPQDDEITDPYVMVVGRVPGTEGPISPQYVLEKIQPEGSLRMIQPYVPADPETGRWRAQLAVCKVFNKRDEYVRQRQLKEQRRADAASGKGKSKALDLSWSIGDHDLDIKLQQMAKFLAKGIKVEVTVERKKRGKKATLEEAAALIKRVREAAEAQGGRVKGEGVGELLRTLKLEIESRGSS